MGGLDDAVQRAQSRSGPSMDAVTAHETEQRGAPPAHPWKRRLLMAGSDSAGSRHAICKSVGFPRETATC
jgi:hypothetical protein